MYMLACVALRCLLLSSSFSSVQFSELGGGGSEEEESAAAATNSSRRRRMGMSAAAVDDIIRRLLLQDPRRGSSRQQQQLQLAEEEIRSLCGAAKDVFMRQPNLLDLDAPIIICGDVHGQYRDLLRIFDGAGGFPPRSKYLFLGDYVDRGDHSLETICLLLAYKVRYPEHFFLLRGNHECASINRIYGFYDECKRRYSVRLWRLFSDCFNCLPVAALVDGRILCVHGGLSPHLRSLDQIRRLPRPCDVPDEGLLCDLLWSDPAGDTAGWAVNHDRGVSCTFGADVVADFLRRHDLDLLCRAHQVVEDGYEFFADRKLVTVFSAPNYCGEFDNAAAVMSIDADLVCSFTVIKPETTRGRTRGISSISAAGLGRRTSSAPPPARATAPVTTVPCSNNNNSNTSTRKGLLRYW